MGKSMCDWGVYIVFVGIDLLEGPINRGNPPFSSHLQPFLRLIPTDAPLPTHTFLPLFLSSLYFISPSPSLLPLFWSQLCNSANDAEKACCQHILQAARAWLHKLVNRPGPLPCQPLIIIRKNGRRRRIGWRGRGEGQMWSEHMLTHFLSLCHTHINRHPITYFFRPSTCLATYSHIPTNSFFIFPFSPLPIHTNKHTFNRARGLLMTQPGGSLLSYYQGP